MPKKVLISGISGQDGSYMADYLLENTDHEIYGLIRHSSNLNIQNYKHLLDNSRFHLVSGDLIDLVSLNHIVEKYQPDYFFNFAAQSFVAESWTTPVNTFKVDALGVIHCLEAIRLHAPHCRFYSAGSSEEVGDVDYSPQDLQHPLKPRSPYGAAKCAAKHIVKVYRESYGLYAIHGRLYNHESERRGEAFVTRKITKGVARIYHAIKNNKSFEPIELGNLDAKRDWSHALDFIDGIWKMVNQSKPKEYLLSSNETHSVGEFVELAFEYAGFKNCNWDIYQDESENNGLPSYDWVDREKNVGYELVHVNPKFYRPAEVDILLGDSSEARAELSWKPKISFEKLVERMVDYDINNYVA